MIEFTLEKCKTKAAYSAKLKKQQKLDLQKIKKTFEIVLETPILLVVKVGGVEVIVHGYGELLFKNCQETDLMRKIAGRIYAAGLNK
ncbi:hypothetical protein HYV87_03570 [Candidatus Woesearchaeota archaeon]|nr:hypothetical protein [Candidatus Woesearchaeota archaeon]MBI2582174.1 hypothetical protein [Candidatus Woesearchaeota archaeon]